MRISSKLIHQNDHYYAITIWFKNQSFLFAYREFFLLEFDGILTQANILFNKFVFRDYLGLSIGLHTFREVSNDEK